MNISGTAGHLQMALAPLESPDRVGLEPRKAKYPAKKRARYVQNMRKAGGGKHETYLQGLKLEQPSILNDGYMSVIKE